MFSSNKNKYLAHIKIDSSIGLVKP